MTNNSNTLGKSDLHVSEISFGCMSLQEGGLLQEKLLQKAFDQGINFFDTADLYDKGGNETLVGKALKPIRKEAIIATKVGNEWLPDGSTWRWNPSKAYILQAVESSLRRLQTDYIDLYQLHGGTIEDPIDETIEAFELLKQQGKIRWYGISSIRPNVIKTYIERSAITSVMMQYSMLDQRPEEEILAKLEENKISVITRGALAQGRLLGYKAGDYLQYTKEEVAAAAAEVALLAHELDVEKAIIPLAYVLAHPAVASAITGVRDERQLQEAISALKTKVKLRAEQLERLRRTVRPFIYDQHR